jgi:hypothetical protein
MVTNASLLVTFLFSELATVNVNREDTIVNLLGRMDEYRRYYQIDIRQCFDDGRHCIIHGLRILGCKLMKYEEHPSVSTAIVSDSQEVEEESLQARQEQQQHTAARGQAGGIRRWLRRVFKKRDQRDHQGRPKTKSQVCVSGAMICRYIDEGVVWGFS